MSSGLTSQNGKKELPGEPVIGFWENYDIQKNTARIWVKTDQSGWQMVCELPPEQAVFLSDMLLNGKQLYYIKGVSLYWQEA